jgi:two-component system LytT family response regulator
VLKTLIIDDEPLAHQVIKYHLQGCDDISVLASCYNATEALRYLAQQQVDLLLLDINMPALSGIELLRVLHNRPAVIIISAYKEYAIEGFELDVVDYLVKPVSPERLFAALNKLRRRLVAVKPTTEPYIVLKVDREQRKFLLNEISLLEAYGNYVKVWQRQHMTLVNSTLKRLLEQLPSQQFVQVHKSFVVNKDKVLAADNEQLRLDGGQQIKVGKLYKQRLISLL